MNITIVGSGYVGITAGICFANVGHSVSLIDKNKAKANHLAMGKLDFFEPGLEKLLVKCIRKESLKSYSDYEKCRKSDFYFVCVDTPTVKGKPKTTNLFAAVYEILKYSSRPSIIVIKSTAPIGTYKKLEKKLENFHKNSIIKHHLVVHPEFLSEGTALKNFNSPDRIIVGTNSKQIQKKITKLYLPTGNANKIIFMKPESAELVKYASNAFLATKISFINEISQISEHSGGIIEEISYGLGLDKRIGPHFLKSGIGWGGSCFPKDLESLIYTKRMLNIPKGIIEASLEVNEFQVVNFYNKILKKGKLSSTSKVSVMGLTFKPDTDDIRNSVGFKLIKMIYKVTKNISVYDPMKNTVYPKIQSMGIDGIKFSSSKLKCINSSEIIIFATEWREFSEINKKYLKNKLVFDGRNIFTNQKLAKSKIEYFSVGS